MDQFLSAPFFQPAGETFQDSETLDMPGYSDTDLEIKRILSEHVPFEEQESIDIEERVIEDTLSSDTEEDALETEPFDPGTFVAVRIEVWEQSDYDRPLVVLETWLPKPALEDEEEAAETTGGTGPRSDGAQPTGGGPR